MRNLIFTLAVIAALAYLGILRSPGWESWFFEQVTSRLDRSGETRQFQWTQALEQLRSQVGDIAESLDGSSLQEQITLLQKRLDVLEATAIQIDRDAVSGADATTHVAEEAEQKDESDVSVEFEMRQPVSLTSAGIEQHFMSRQERRHELLNLAEGMELKALGAEQ